MDKNKTAAPVQWMTTKEVCEYIKVSRQTLMRYINQQDFPGYKHGRDWRFDRKEVDAWIRGGVHHKVFFIESEKDHDL